MPNSPVRYQPVAQSPVQHAAISQTTAIEQSRAVAEVQAAVFVGQQVPRDMNRAEAEMRDVCGRLSMANRAFYTVPNRGTGPTVHLMRELARIWGNLQYGVHELSRDDDAGRSEVQAFAWDVQTNTRSTRTFISPHARMAGGERKKLTDLGDIYLSNQNTGARAVRECIMTVLPTWFAEEAQDLCRQTLENGEGEPLPDRITRMIAAFRKIGVTVEQMEQKITRKRGAWTAADVAEMAITYTSITRDGLDKNDEFPPVTSVTAATVINAQAEPKTEQVVDDESVALGQASTSAAKKESPKVEPPQVDASKPVAKQDPPNTSEKAAPKASGKPTVEQLTALAEVLANEGHDTTAKKVAYLTKELGRKITLPSQLTPDEVDELVGSLRTEQARDAHNQPQQGE
jgi:hypothetical protein